LSYEAQRTEILKLWDELFQAGAQGGVVFEWNDEWWKHAESMGDEERHDGDDPEEWFGLIEFTSSEQAEGLPRPAYQAFKAYNQAILLSPVSGERYEERIPVTVYAAEGIAQIRAQLDKGKWYTAVKLNRHWWKVLLPVGPKARAGEHRVVMEAYSAKHRLVLRRERSVLLDPAQRPIALALSTDRASYEAGRALEPVRYTVAVTDNSGKPLANQVVHWSIVEPQATTDLTQTRLTDADGRIEGTYLVHEPGIVLLSAATPYDSHNPQRRVGDETFIVVRQLPTLGHQPSMWEPALPGEIADALRHETAAFRLADPGSERLVDYARYGKFLDVGTPTYRYEVRDWEGLAVAVGEGIYPNEGGLLKDPAYQAAKKAGALEGSHWDFTFLDNPQLSFFKWAQTEEEVGVKQFYTALTLERAGLLLQAVKAYYAVLVHFPTSIGWTAFDPPTPWYVGKVAREKIESILRLHPELGMRLEGARVIVQNGFDNAVDNDTIIAYPGNLLSVAPDAVNPPSVDTSSLTQTRTVGKGRVQLIQYENGHWRMSVDGTPWVVRGMTYKPTAVGETPDEGPLPDWMTMDRNGNGRRDVLETFVDANRNNRQDAEEPTVGDFALLHELGANTLRLYHTDHDVKEAKTLLRRLHDDYGLMVMMGDFVGMYTIGSGAKWEDGTDYLDKAQRKRMFGNVKKMVRAFKDEPYLLMWVLGNENNYGGVHGIVGGVGNAGRYPKEYYSFINELATWIHSVDPDHPVAIGNGDVLFLDLISRYAPAIDIFGANTYRGPHGFGRALFEEVQRWLDRPVLITEFGCPAYQVEQTREVAERDQALYHFGSWVDLAENMAGRGVGNAIGGVVFEWSDEWWKAGQPPRFSPRIQETQPNWAGPFPGGWNFEEWYGLVSQGDGSMSPYLRQLRLSYRLYQQLWRQ
jgi:beta-glucuronidase